jgi:hypothetical protein
LKTLFPVFEDALSRLSISANSSGLLLLRRGAERSETTLVSDSIVKKTTVEIEED